MHEGVNAGKRKLEPRGPSREHARVGPARVLQKRLGLRVPGLGDLEVDLDVGAAEVALATVVRHLPLPLLLRPDVEAGAAPGAETTEAGSFRVRPCCRVWARIALATLLP